MFYVHIALFDYNVRYINDDGVKGFFEYLSLNGKIKKKLFSLKNVNTLFKINFQSVFNYYLLRDREFS